SASLALAPNGTLYVGLISGNQILRRENDGRTTVVAGTGIPGFSGDGGPATQAQFNSFLWLGMAVGPDGTLYLSDLLNQRVRRVTTDGIINTIAGGGQPTNSNGHRIPRKAIKLDI